MCIFPHIRRLLNIISEYDSKRNLTDLPQRPELPLLLHPDLIFQQAKYSLFLYSYNTSPNEDHLKSNNLSNFHPCSLTCFFYFLPSLVPSLYHWHSLYDSTFCSPIYCHSYSWILKKKEHQQEVKSFGNLLTNQQQQLPLENLRHSASKDCFQPILTYPQ